MPPVIEIRLEGAPSIINKLGRIGPEVMNAMMHEAVKVGVAAAKANAPQDTNGLVESIQGRVTGFSGVSMEGRIWTDKPYAATQEYGRRAGARQPPSEALIGWASRHGFDTSRQSLFLLARSIARNGFKGKTFMEAAAKEVDSKYGDILDAGAKVATRIWGGG